MRNQSILATSVLVVLSGCGTDTGESTASATGDEAAPMQHAELPGGGAGEALVISKRTYTSGTVKAKVTGFFKIDGSQGLHKPASITNDGHTWIMYGNSGAPELNVLFINAEDMAENGVTIGVGPYTVTGRARAANAGQSST